MGRTMIVLSAALISTGETLPAQEPALPRRADLAVAFAISDSGVIVRHVTPLSAATVAGLRVGDRVLAMNGQLVERPESFRRAQQRVRVGEKVRLLVRRGDEETMVEFEPIAVAPEQIPGVSMEYGSFRSPRGYRVATLVTRPSTARSTKLPALLFIPWLSCDPVEKPVPGSDGFAHMLRALASESGMLTMRVEKPGVGDSEGPWCGDTALDDDMDAFRSALASLRKRADVDTGRIYLLGGSIGGALAPLLAAEEPRGIRGVISVGGFTRTWYEHMLDIERRRLELSGRTPELVNAEVRGFSRFYTEYLINRKTPREVIALHPDLSPLWYDEPTRQYGRRAEYFHAVQQLNVERAWRDIALARISALIVWGEYDWIMGRAEQERAVNVLNDVRPGSAQLVVLPETDHGLMRYASAKAAFSDDSPVHDGAAAAAILSWLRRQN